MGTSDPAIVLTDIKKAYKGLVVLRGINLTIERGSVLALLGPNGAGKTTTVRILSTLIRPDEGSARILGFDVVAEAHHVRGVIGLTGQYAAVDELLSGRENLDMLGRLYHLTGTSVRTRREELLERFDLREAADRPVKTYSGGMKRRLDLALSLIASPPVLFLDEPTTGLDPRSRMAMWDIITELKREGTTVLLTTQYLEEADKLADRIAVLDQGTIIAEGTAASLKAQVGNDRIELTLALSEHFARASTLLQGDGVQCVHEERRISIPTDGSVRSIKRVLAVLEAEGIELEALSVHQPTLDDVFLHYTGKGTATADTSAHTTP